MLACKARVQEVCKACLQGQSEKSARSYNHFAPLPENISWLRPCGLNTIIGKDVLGNRKENFTADHETQVKKQTYVAFRSIFAKGFGIFG